MTDEALLDLAFSAAADVKGIKDAQLESNKALFELQKFLEDVRKENEPVVYSDALVPVVEEHVSGGFEGMTQFEHETLEFAYMHTVTGFVIAATLLVSLGVQLFQTFNKHMR